MPVQEKYSLQKMIDGLRNGIPMNLMQEHTLPQFTKACMPKILETPLLVSIGTESIGKFRAKCARKNPCPGATDPDLLLPALPGRPGAFGGASREWLRGEGRRDGGPLGLQGACIGIFGAADLAAYERDVQQASLASLRTFYTFFAKFCQGGAFDGG